MKIVFCISAFVLIAAVIYYKFAVMDEDSFAFTAEWFDEASTMTRVFRLLYFPTSNKIQLFEPRTHKMFLKKTSVEGLKPNDIYVGNTIVILSRMFTIKSYADDYTKKALGHKSERTFAMVKPDAVKHMGSIIQFIYEKGLTIRSATMATMTEAHASEFYREHVGKPFLPSLIRYVTSGPVLALQLQGERAMALWRKMIGPTDPIQAHAEDPTSLRARFGTDKTYNGFHGSDSNDAAQREISFFFPSVPQHREMAPRSSATLNNCTCCLVKPHAVTESQLGPILSAIQSGGFSISALEMVRFDRTSAAEFHEVYDGVLYEYMDMVAELKSGPSVVLEVTRSKEATNGHGDGAPAETQVVQSFRELVGPMDPDLARKIRPNSLRAKFGKTKIQNAIHCTDLPEDGVLEVEYAFKILREGW